MAGFGCCTGKSSVGGGSSFNSPGVGGKGGGSKSSELGVKCYCQENILWQIHISSLEERDKFGYTSVYSSTVESITTTGCRKEKAGVGGFGDFWVETDDHGTPGDNNFDMVINISQAVNCGDCTPARGGESWLGPITNECEYRKGIKLAGQTHVCRCIAQGNAGNPPPCECGIIFNIVNSIKYAQKCVLACEAKRPINCYWAKLGVMGQLLEPLKPGYVLSRRWNTKYCKVRNEPWKTQLITDVKAYMTSIGIDPIRKCKEVRKICDSFDKKQ